MSDRDITRGSVSFDDEWAGIRTATNDQQTAMRLNQLDGGGGGGGSQQFGTLKVEQTDLAAIGDAAFKLRQRLGTDGDQAKASTQEAGMAMKLDFALGPALATMAEK
ncbi:hypothetical protein ASC82_05465 [Streptomyces sp. Root431]|uniref:hypothetical protein n=1 Tax=Streptomyces sp. Root431 TaxID=1736535 RepID=UPI0006FAD291|nr:hypothetical protein [Streptomyces sp. Root431]KQX14746.1 hypothetical protein ASC82_05465 [Streptomyces sp. Root431]